MDRKRRILLAAVLLSCLSVEPVGAQNAGPPGGLAVRVENTPLPVYGTIDISGTPAVTISGTANVQITNPASSPVGVRNVESPARNRFQAGGGCAMTPGLGACEINFTVPANKLLVIETVSVQQNVQPGQKPFALITTTQNGQYKRFFIPLQPMATFNGYDFYNSLHLVRLYSDPGTTVQVIGERDTGGGEAGAEATISGYLVDCGSGPGPCSLP